MAYILVRLWEPDGRRIPALTVDTDSGEEEELRLPARGHLSNGGNLDQINLYLYLRIHSFDGFFKTKNASTWVFAQWWELKCHPSSLSTTQHQPQVLAAVKVGTC